MTSSTPARRIAAGSTRPSPSTPPPGSSTTRCLGISHVYASNTCARCRAVHTATRHRSTRLIRDRRRGDLSAVRGVASRRDMGHIIDLVPNTWASRSQPTPCGRTCWKTNQLALRPDFRYRLAPPEAGWRTRSSCRFSATAMVRCLSGRTSARVRGRRLPRRYFALRSRYRQARTTRSSAPASGTSDEIGAESDAGIEF